MLLEVRLYILTLFCLNTPQSKIASIYLCLWIMNSKISRFALANGVIQFFFDIVL